jgi:hypothetical protein
MRQNAQNGTYITIMFLPIAVIFRAMVRKGNRRYS